jgi:predicted enzyme related to lactoylglutathione lyase
MRPIHFEILVDDPQTAIDFYRSVFGWEIEEWEEGGEQYWLVTTGPDNAPGINGAIMGRHFPQAVINTVEVASLEVTIKKVMEVGGKKVHGPNEIPGVGKHAYCADPEGNLFGILQPASELGEN